MAEADSVSLTQLQAWCESHEKVLRWQYSGALPVSWEAELASLPATSAAAAVQRLALLKHFYRTRHEEEEKRNAAPAEEDRRDAARKLLTREPVPVTLESGRQVRVTGRGYLAMMEISAHHNRIRVLMEDLEYAGARYEESVAGAKLAPWMRASPHRRRARRWGALYQRIASEIVRHRERLYAHATTPDGAAAKPDEPAPEWWKEATTRDDARVLAALYEAGPLRYNQMGPPPEQRGKGPKGEDWGWSGLLASWGVRKKVDPAAMYDTDLGQVIAEMRVSAPPALVED